MVFENLASLGGIISLVINVIITGIVIWIVGKAIAHQGGLKRAMILAVIAFLVVPYLIAFTAPFIPAIAMIGVILPLVVWIILGELLLPGTRKQKLIIAVIAYLVNLFLLSMVSGMIVGLLPF